MTPTPALRKQLETLKALAAPEPPILVARMVRGEEIGLVLEAARAKHPDVEFGMAVLTRIWGAPLRPEYVRDGAQ